MTNKNKALHTLKRGLLLCFFLVFLFPLAPGTGLAATSPSPRDATTSGSIPQGAPVRAIQKRLKEIGLYTGGLNGRLDGKTIDAIRAYQQQSALPVDGIASESLLIHLGSAAHQARRLLGQLEDSRQKQSDTARKALSSNPKVRALLRNLGEFKEKVFNFGSDSEKARSCYASPTPDCLIGEAMEATENIEKTELRNWALSGLVATQAFAGDVAAALRITSRISDPRLVMTALGRISQAQVLSGKLPEARKTAAAIPDPKLQAEAYLAIAGGQLAAGNRDAAKNMLRHSLAAAEQIGDAHQNALLLTEIAKVEAEAGNYEGASKLLEKAEILILSEKGSGNHERTLGQLAAARAKIGLVDEALVTANRITEEDWRVTAYILAAGHKADAGDFPKALKLADGISNKRFRAVALSRVAIAQGIAGDESGAQETLRRAQELSKDISVSYGNDYALSRIAVALAKIGIFKDATETAFRIKNGPLQVRTLWSVILEQRRAKNPGAASTEAKTSTAMEALPNNLDKTWVMSDIALTQQESGFKDEARNTFDRALWSARSIKSDWLRARALGKLAETLVVLQGRSQ